MTNPLMPGRKLHNVENLRGLGSHRKSGIVKLTPERKKNIISQMVINHVLLSILRNLKA